MSEVEDDLDPCVGGICVLPTRSPGPAHPPQQLRRLERRGRRDPNSAVAHESEGSGRDRTRPRNPVRMFDNRDRTSYVAGLQAGRA